MSSDLAELKRAASGRWPEILCRLGGIDERLLDGKHHPCPRCQGKDRFRLLDEADGAVFCNGQGIAASAEKNGTQRYTARLCFRRTSVARLCTVVPPNTWLAQRREPNCSPSSAQ